ncbi:MAG: thioredoxin family protein [bacterium]
MSTSISPSRHPVVPEQEWIVARRELLAREKAFTREQEGIAAARRALPWVRVEKEYVFETLGGNVSLAELFDGRSQLIVKHNMLNPKHDVCVGCSLEMDHIEGALVHLPHRDVTFVAISRAPVEQIQAAQRRMGWSATWVSSFHNDFNYDFHASFRPEVIASGEVFYNYEVAPIPIEDLSGFSVFYKDENGDIYLTYASFGRGQENIISAYVMLDMTPKGRDETGQYRGMRDWARPHDRYDTDGFIDPIGQFVSTESCCHRT